MAFAPPAVQSVKGAPEAGCARGRPPTGRAPETHPSEFPKPPLGCVSGRSRCRSGGRKPRRERNFLSFSGPVMLGNFPNAVSQCLDSAKFSGIFGPDHSPQILLYLVGKAFAPTKCCCNRVPLILHFAVRPFRTPQHIGGWFGAGGFGIGPDSSVAPDLGQEYQGGCGADAD